MNHYLGDRGSYNYTLNNFRYYVKKFKTKYNKEPDLTIDKNIKKLWDNVGEPYTGKTKIKKPKFFIWRNESWNKTI